MRRLIVFASAFLIGTSSLLVGNSFTHHVRAARAIPKTAEQDSLPPPILSISVCTPDNLTGNFIQGSCDPGSFDTHQKVLGPDGQSINRYVDGGISDEHQSVFPPGKLHNGDYVFFVASRTKIGPDTGVLVLSGVKDKEPDLNGQWTLDYAKDYGVYPAPSPSPSTTTVHGQVLLSPTGNGCPTVATRDPADQDQTFDLNYAAAGSVVLDPTSKAGSMLMVYEGTNTCFGTIGGGRSDGFYSTVGIATSLDFGRTWPTYRGTPYFQFVPLPGQNPMQGPNPWPIVPTPAVGEKVYEGNDTQTIPPATYGRYPVLSPTISIATAMATGTPLPNAMGDAEMSAFVDDVTPNKKPYLYAVYNDNLGAGTLIDPAEIGGMTIARAQLNGGSGLLSFDKWSQGTFVPNSGVGGLDSPIFAKDGFPHDCLAANQKRFGGSLSYVEATHQYLLTFVCTSPGDPAKCAPGQTDCFSTNKPNGAAWFYATSYDPSDPSQWSQPDALGRPQPLEIQGSWSPYDADSPDCPSFKGWYPTFMSLNNSPGHLLTDGFVFYLHGCQTSDNTREYSSRQFSITMAGG